jgi:dolichol-phosphate mannosyltransferase
MKVLIILPTFNEAANIAGVLSEINLKYPQIEILHIDDNSPDKTAEIAENLKISNYRQIRNFKKLGLGSAYIQGFKWAIDKGFDFIVTMDSDGSHHVDEIAKLIEAGKGTDLVIGARWIPGGSVINWPIYRKALSKFGTWYSRIALKLPFADLTSGFRIYRTTALKKINFSSIQNKGYVFQIQMVELFYTEGMRIAEVPITFTERTQGKSKMSGRIAREALSWISREGIRRRFSR